MQLQLHRDVVGGNSGIQMQFWEITIFRRDDFEIPQLSFLNKIVYCFEINNVIYNLRFWGF